MSEASRYKQSVAPKAVRLLQEKFADDVLSAEAFAGQHFVNVKHDRIREILTFLRDHEDLKYECLMDLCGLDYLNQGMPERFAVGYHLYSFENKELFRVKAFLPEDDPTIDSAHDLFASANWAEREAYDLFGIRFNEHPNQIRILLPDNYVGYPLRKDYPLRGMGERDAFPRYVPDEDPKE